MPGMAGEAELADFALLKAVTAVVQSAEAQASHPGQAVAELLVNAERELWGGRRQLWLTSRTLLGYSAKLKDSRNPLRLEWSLSTFRILALGSFTHSKDNPA